MIGDRMTAATESDQYEDEIAEPSEKQRGHEPMAELEDMIDLVAMLGSVRRLTEEFVDEREATHIE